MTVPSTTDTSGTLVGVADADGLVNIPGIAGDRALGRLVVDLAAETTAVVLFTGIAGFDASELPA